MKSDLQENKDREALLGHYLKFRNGKKSPVRNETGDYAVYGSNGQIGQCDETNTTGPSIVIGRVGSYCGSVYYSSEPVWVTDNAIVCEAKFSDETHYWYYALQTLDLNGRSSGSGQPLLNQSVLRSIKYEPPNRSRRLAIADVLGALDDKIAANTKLIATLDSLSEAQFHAALHDSQPQPLSRLASFVNGKAFTKGASGTGRVVVRIAELNSGIGKSTVFSDAEVDDKHVARPGDILFAWSGSLTLHRWFRDEAIVNQHIFKVIPNEATADWLIYELLRNRIEHFKMIAANKATTMGHIQRKHLDEPVLVPSKTAQREIAPLMESLWQTALTAERENLSLAATRDALLPQLMSGKLRVRDAEKVLEDAL